MLVQLNYVLFCFIFSVCCLIERIWHWRVSHCAGCGLENTELQATSTYWHTWLLANACPMSSLLLVCSQPLSRKCICNVQISSNFFVFLACSFAVMNLGARVSSQQFVATCVLRCVHLMCLCQECPKCRATIEKDGGCNHMVCKRCKFDFCWVCLGSWEPHGSSWYISLQYHLQLVSRLYVWEFLSPVCLSVCLLVFVFSVSSLVLCQLDEFSLLCVLVGCQQ